MIANCCTPNLLPCRTLLSDPPRTDPWPHCTARALSLSLSLSLCLCLSLALSLSVSVSLALLFTLCLSPSHFLSLCTARGGWGMIAKCCTPNLRPCRFCQTTLHGATGWGWGGRARDDIALKRGGQPRLGWSPCLIYQANGSNAAPMVPSCAESSDTVRRNARGVVGQGAGFGVEGVRSRA